MAAPEVTLALSTSAGAAPLEVTAVAQTVGGNAGGGGTGIPTWEDVHVATTTYKPSIWATSHTITLAQPAPEGHFLVMAIACGTTSLAATPAGWSIDRAVISGYQHGYLLSRAVPAGGLSAVTLTFTTDAPNNGNSRNGPRPAVLVYEMAGITALDAIATTPGLGYNSATSRWTP